LSELRLIVGLGNPGPDYEYTRHNLGFLVVQYLCQKHHLKLRRSFLCRGWMASGSLLGQECVFLLPMTFMNHSGVAVKKVLAAKKISLENMLVVCDDFNLEFGEVRLRRQGSSGGHHGLSSIIEQLGASDFPRLRLGIGSPKGRQDTVDFVLEEFSQGDKKQLGAFIEEAAGCCEIWLTANIDKAMSQFNKRERNEKV
jgi:PTH1 family peptidyl-tRNA hydrolase